MNLEERSKILEILSGDFLGDGGVKQEVALTEEKVATSPFGNRNGDP